MVNDLNRAVEVANMVIEPLPIGRPDQATILDRLSFWLSERYEQSGSIEDLHCSIEALNKAIEATPFDDPNRDHQLNNLSRSVEVLTTAVEAVAPGHPKRAQWLHNLGLRLYKLYEQTGTWAILTMLLKLSAWPWMLHGP